MKYIPLLLMLSLNAFSQLLPDSKSFVFYKPATQDELRHAPLPKQMAVHKLSWSEYKMKPPKDSTWSSMTGYEWSMDITTSSEGEVSAEVRCYFLPYLSWTRTHDSATLQHEQFHLFISDMYCRQFNKALKAIAGCKSCEETVNSMYQNAWERMIGYEHEYDRITEHSLNKTEQHLWERLIYNQLKQVQ